MNRIDKERYKHLKALSNIPTDKPYGKYRTEVVKKYGRFMEGETWKELHNLDYINVSPSKNHILTLAGLEQLRILEDMRRKELTLVISIIAIAISFVSLAKSMGWL